MDISIRRNSPLFLGELFRTLEEMIFMMLNMFTLVILRDWPSTSQCPQMMGDEYCGFSTESLSDEYSEM